MGDFRYRAFLSYSHRDERWGRWLQRALESYRVPRRLVGAEGRFGPVPARLSPVFRDREDLSSAADLSASVREELAQSETLVVICSPAAAASPWVNEEIRFFRSFGRGERILALIVGGDPGSTDPESRCFPPALVEGADAEPFEPLAADARKWADGKSLARLKLVAGIVGIRLDDLRQRDMQRRHRVWMISAGGAMAVALVTTVLAIVAVTARNQAENRREHAENLVGYMVGDLRRKLDEVGRLDILQGLGGEVSDYLDTLDPREVTDESLAQQAIVWRQLGEVAMDQGKLEEAMPAFQGSREVLAELHRRKPLDPERLNQLGNAEFWIGYVHLERGEFEAARAALDRYLDHANRLVELDPNNPEWLMEQSFALGNIAALIIRQQSAEVERALERIEEAVDINRRVIDLAPDNSGYVSEYGEALAWQADTQMLLCDLGGALKSRQENVAIARRLLEGEPGNSALRRRYAYSLTGLANVAILIGLNAYALEHLKDAADILGEIFAVDPSNLDLRWDQLRVEVLIALLRGETEGIPVALERLEGLYEPQIRLVDQAVEQNVRQQQEWVEYLLRYAQLAWWAGDRPRAAELKNQAAERLRKWVGAGDGGPEWQNEIIFARFLYWDQAGDPDSAQNSSRTLGASVASLPKARLDPDQPHMSCTDRSSLVLQALMEGDRAQAGAHTEQLLGKGYFEAGFVRICRRYDLCQGAG